MLLTFSPSSRILLPCHESLLTKHPHAEILYIGDLNVHHTDWFQSTHTDVGGIEAFHFSLSNELEQIIKHPTNVPDRHDRSANIYDLFFTSNPQNYTYTISSPLISSNHCTVSVLHILLHHHLSLLLSVIYGTLRTPGMLT